MVRHGVPPDGAPNSPKDLDFGSKYTTKPMKACLPHERLFQGETDGSFLDKWWGELFMGETETLNSLNTYLGCEWM